MDRIHLAQDKVHWRAVNGNKPSGSINGGDFLDYQSEYGLFKDSAPWNYCPKPIRTASGVNSNDVQDRLETQGHFRLMAIDLQVIIASLSVTQKRVYENSVSLNEQL